MKKYLRATIVDILDEEPEVQADVAMSSRTRPDVLAKLSDSDDIRVLAAVGNNPSTPVDILEKLSTNIEPEVRAAVGVNPEAPMELVNKIYDSDKHYTVINTMLSNFEITAVNSSDPVVLDRLAHFTYYTIRRYVAYNPEAPAEVLEILVDDPEPSVQMAAIENDNLNPETLRRIATTGDEFQRYCAVYNKTIPIDLLEQLANDEDPDVHRRAKEMLDWKRRRQRRN